MRTRNLVLIILIFYDVLLSGISANAQNSIVLKCGDIVEGEIIQEGAFEFERSSVNRYSNDYLLDTPAGTRINLIVSPLGMTFNVAFVILDSSENDVLGVNEVIQGETETLNDFEIGSSRQILRVVGARPDAARPERGIYAYPSDAGLFFGAYEIRLGCTLRDGTVIEPGDSLTQGDAAQPTVVAPPSFGFPGLQPVDFASAFRLPLTMDTPTQGEIPPSGDAVLGFRFNGTAGDILDLSFERTSGNLNLGIVVLSADNEVAYMAALVTSQSMNTRFSLPATGEYTIGVFRISLVPPSSPEATGFTITTALNP